MKKMTWKTFARKLRDGELEVNSWGQDEGWVQVTLFAARGERRREVLELTGKRVEL